MKNKIERYYQKDEIGKRAFIGRITSNVTHEINNIFSIINEYSGVIEDKIYAAMNGADFDVEKVMLYLQKIQDQIDRGKKINKNLNQFSHSADEDILDFELGSTLESMTLLAKRFARLKEIDLEFQPSVKEIYLKSSLLDLEQNYFSAIHSILFWMESGSKLTANIKINPDNQAAIQLNCSDFDPAKFNEAKSFFENEINTGIKEISLNSDTGQLKILIKINK